MMAAALGEGKSAHILVGGAGGTAQEVLTMGPLEPGWRFTAVDPSPAMIAPAAAGVAAAGLADRVTWVTGYIDGLPQDATFDAATLIGVLHHLPEDAAKKSILKSIATRLKPGAPFILACNHYAYTAQPLMLAVWRQRWRMQGATSEEITAKLGKIQHAAMPPESEEAVFALLDGAGFEQPVRFFSSLFWGAWLVRLR
jgi:tRNA (cmo5U34)-methyltransferase